MVDILVIGAGPAGLTAAVYARRAGHTVTVFERLSYGGQIINTPEIENYPAIRRISGVEFSTDLYNQAVGLGAEIRMEDVTAVELAGPVKRVTTTAGQYEGRAVIIANGVQRRQLGVPGEERLTGRGVSYCATCDGAFYRGQDVAVVGGGNTALEDAMFLANNCRQVHLIHRRDAFRGSRILVEALLQRENITVHYDSRVAEIRGEKRVESVVLEGVKSGTREELPVNGVFIAVGLSPVNRLFEGILEMDEGGYLRAGEDCHTNLEGVFAAGDTRVKSVRQLVTAAADGAVAAVEAANYLNQQL